MIERLTQMSGEMRLESSETTVELYQSYCLTTPSVITTTIVSFLRFTARVMPEA